MSPFHNGSDTVTATFANTIANLDRRDANKSDSATRNNVTLSAPSKMTIAWDQDNPNQTVTFNNASGSASGGTSSWDEIPAADGSKFLVPVPGQPGTYWVRGPGHANMRCTYTFNIVPEGTEKVDGSNPLPYPTASMTAEMSLTVIAAYINVKDFTGNKKIKPGVVLGVGGMAHLLLGYAPDTQGALSLSGGGGVLEFFQKNSDNSFTPLTQTSWDLSTEAGRQAWRACSDNLYAKGVKTGGFTLTATYAFDGATATDKVVGAVVSIDFKPDANHPYGYVEVQDTLNPADHWPVPTGTDWINCEDSGTTFSLVTVKVEPSLYGKFVSLKMSNTTKAYLADASGNKLDSIKLTGGSGSFALRGNCQGKGTTSVLADIPGATSYQILGVAVYKMRKIDKVTLVDVTCGTSTTQTSVTGNDILAANALLRRGLVEISTVETESASITFTDTNGNGAVDYGSGIVDESGPFTTGYGGSENHLYIVHIPYPLIGHYTRQDGSTYIVPNVAAHAGTPIVISDGAGSNGVTTVIAHEIMHNMGPLDVGPDGKNTNNLMFHIAATGCNFLSYFPVQLYYQSVSATQAPGTQNQWDTIHPR